MATLFPNLSSHGTIKNIELKNRIIKAPQHTGLANPDGSVTDRMIRHYKELAAGGAAMVIVEYAWIDNDASRAAPCQLGIAGMDHIAGLSLLAQTIRANGAKAAIQISHAGRQKFLLSRPIKAASRIPWEEIHSLGCPPPDELTFKEIQEIIKAFGLAAKRAQLSDFDMVEIHGCHGYLIPNFLSPHTNKRTDWYGGSLENRMRFLLEVVAEVIKNTGDYPISVRLSGIDYEPDGTTIEETIEIAKRLEEMGVSVLHISGGNHHQTIHEVSPMAMPLANNTWAAEAVKKAVNIPVIASGSITLPEIAESILTDKKADFIALGRPLWADPYWPQKTVEDRPEDIRPCIRCNDGCLARGDQLGKTVSCSVNVATCREEEFQVKLTKTPRKVAVIGGGPAGMEAAIVSALQGHNVTLYEKRALGGALLEAAYPDFKLDLRALIKYFITRINKLNINVVKSEATLQTVRRGNFDWVIAATGTVPIIPDVPGINSPSVFTYLQILNGKIKTGQNIAVIGAGMVGTEVGLLLAEQGKSVTFFEILDTVMNGILTDEKQVYENRFKKLRVSFKPGKRLESVSGADLIFMDRLGNRTGSTADSIVIACGSRPNRKLLQQIKSRVTVPVVDVGDCVRPGKIFDAIHDGHLAAKLIR